MNCTEAEARAMMAVSTAISLAIAEGRSDEDLAVIAALFEVIGDQLALLLTVRERGNAGVRQGPSSRQDQPICRPS